MSDIAIRVENLGKQYRIGQYETAYKNLRESIMNLFARRDRNPETIWAIKDVSFEVKPGEVVGIIGRNGAGKSTLLKILTRITEPTEGHAELHGRVGSLLEVGTGFHPELTGRENIFLNGAILGMKKTEIKRKFDEILAFAEIEKFIDTPVKRYSSGMYVRLAFAVAAHLEPEILLVDEVLAVGDFAFQKKCLGKMGNVAKEGRTVLFISHNMAAIENLCPRVIVLEEGRMGFDGKTESAVVHYLASARKNGSDLRNFSRRKGSGLVRIVDVKLGDGQGRFLQVVPCGKPVDILIQYENYGLPKNTSINVGISVKSAIDTPISLLHNRMVGVEFKDIGETGLFVCRMDSLPLTPSVYRLGFSIMQGHDFIDSIPGALELTVEASNFMKSGELPPSSFGPLVLQADWSLEKLDPGHAERSDLMS